MEMEREGEVKKEAASYRYWVRDIKDEDKAPPPLPRKLPNNNDNNDNNDINNNNPSSTLGSLWDSAGTWEEKSLNKWANDRLKELLVSVDSLEFIAGKAQITQLTKCVGDAFLVTVRNKKRVGYTYELTLQVKGEWIVNEEKMSIQGYLDIPEFSFGELDDLQMEVRLNDEKGILNEDKKQIIRDLKQFLNLIRQKLVQFEKEIKDR